MPSYSWQSVFRQAQDEPDLAKLHDRVMEAEGAIFERMQELSSDGAGQAARTESREIQSALNDLLHIKSERLNWPMPGLKEADFDKTS
jgi:hypothetical protein